MFFVVVFGGGGGGGGGGVEGDLMESVCNLWYPEFQIMYYYYYDYFVLLYSLHGYYVPLYIILNNQLALCIQIYICIVAVLVCIIITLYNLFNCIINYCYPLAVVWFAFDGLWEN